MSRTASCRTDWAAAFSPRTLQAYSAYPLLAFPTHYVGDEGWYSDTGRGPSSLLLSSSLSSLNFFFSLSFLYSLSLYFLHSPSQLRWLSLPPSPFSYLSSLLTFLPRSHLPPSYLPSLRFLPLLPYPPPTPAIIPSPSFPSPPLHSPPSLSLSFPSPPLLSLSL